MDFVHFLGRFHVLALHLPIAAIPLAWVVDWLGRGGRRPGLAPAAHALWALAAASAVVTAALGYLHLAEGGFDAASAAAHRAYGTLVAAGAVGVWWARSRGGAAYRRLHLGAAALLVALLVPTGHHGGNLTHGSAYLLEHAPRPIRALVGAPPVGGGAAVELARRSTDAEITASLAAAGYLVRLVSEQDSRLIVGVYSPGTAIGAAELAPLVAAADRIVELNLQRAAIADRDLEALPVFPELTRLRLDNNALTDAGVAALARQPELTHLNLHANPGVTDASVRVLAGFESLRKLFLWQTAVSADGIAELKRLRPDLQVEPGS